MSQQPAVLVTRKIFDDALERLRAHFDVQSNDADDTWPQTELMQRLQGKVGAFITGGDKIDGSLLAACPQLKVVSSMAVGYNNIDIPACAARGVVVTNAPGVLTETTADLGFGLMMAAARRFSETERILRSGGWNRWAVDMFCGAEVHGATLGVLGMGRIGQAIARRGELGFGMKVIYHNRSRLASELEAPLQARYVSKDELLSQSDHLVIVMPYSPQAHHIIGAAELAHMKTTATLTNVARGGLVDDAALVQALRAGRLAAAGLDVYEGEPNLHPGLLDLPNVVLLPHIGSATLAARRAMVHLAVDNLIGVLTTGCAVTPVTP
jgi:glyoxylate/hydroxypyruvate/2-ketogluconate reductase